MAKGLLKSGDAEGLRTLIDGMVDEARGRLEVQDAMDKLRWGDDAIGFPDDVESPFRVRSGMAASQLGLILGMFSADMPHLRVAAEPGSAARSETAERVELWTNNIRPVLEAQGGAVWQPLLEDVLEHGFGMSAVEFVPKRMGRLPKLDDYGSPDEYSSARTSAKRDMASPTGRLPMIWRRVPATRAFWRESPDEEDQLSLVVEYEERSVKDLLESERYKRRFPKLREKVDAAAGIDRQGALSATCAFWRVTDRHLCSTFVTAPFTIKNGTLKSDGTTTPPTVAWSTDWVWATYTNGEIADQYPAPLGRPHYAVCKGLSSNSLDPRHSLRGVYYDMRHLIVALNHFLSWQATYARDQSFPAWYLEQSPVRINGQDVFPDTDDGGQPKPVKLRRGNAITRLPAGTKLNPASHPGPGPQVMQIMAEIRRHANLLGVPDSILESGASDSGYLYASLANTVFSRLRPVIEGIKRWWIQDTRNLHDTLTLIGEPLDVWVGEG